MLINQDDNTEQSVGAELYLKRAVPDGNGGYKWEGKKVLIPLREQQRREVTAAANEIVTGLQQAHVNPDAPLRYEPEYRERKTPAPEFFFSGRGNKTLKTARKSWVEKQNPK